MGFGWFCVTITITAHRHQLGQGATPPLNHSEIIAQELSLDIRHVAAAIQLLDEDNTIPFIARYRKEMTGAMDDETLRNLSERLKYLRQLDQRKSEVIALIEAQEKLTDELKAEILSAKTLQRVDDLYRPFRPKRTTRAQIARERGLEPLANWLFSRPAAPKSQWNAMLEREASRYIDPENKLPDIETVLQGARDIIAEQLSDDSNLRERLRQIGRREAIIESQAVSPTPDHVPAGTYDTYAEFRESIKNLRPHQILALNRGERQEALKVRIEFPDERCESLLIDALINPGASGPVKPDPGNASLADAQLIEAAQDAWKRLLKPAVERDLRNELTEKAEDQAIRVFAANLRSLLLLPPLKGRITLGIDPGYRTGCKVAVVDETGKLLETAVIYPTPPQNQIDEAKTVLTRLIQRHKVTVIAIGNGTASRETEQFVAQLISELNVPHLGYLIVDEAGASVYSASPIARKEFPKLDVSERSAVSIARRLQDPLAELVKIDPKSIGVGQYQHDVDQKRLEETLGGVVESAVNQVGVDLNTASAQLLTYVSGLTATVAENIVKFREENGAFSSRQQLRKVSRLGPKTFEQCAGFLRIPEAPNPLDQTPIHPESYEAATSFLNRLGFDLDDVGSDRLRARLDTLTPKEIRTLSDQLSIGLPTLEDIVDALKKPGRDPREDLPPPILRQDVMTIEDLKEGMRLKGTVRNVVDFGVFVDIGVHVAGLVHISELADRYVKHPLDVVTVGDVVSVRVLSVDVKRGRISLSMKDA